MAYNFTKKLKALRFCSPYEKICQAWKDDPSPFHANPHLFIVGLNSCSVLFWASLAAPILPCKAPPLSTIFIHSSFPPLLQPPIY